MFGTYLCVNGSTVLVGRIGDFLPAVSNTRVSFSVEDITSLLGVVVACAMQCNAQQEPLYCLICVNPNTKNTCNKAEGKERERERERETRGKKDRIFVFQHILVSSQT